METQQNHGSNLAAIKDQLERGWRISVQSVLHSVGTQELRHYISILRREPGIHIESVWTTADNGKRFKEYFIAKPKAA